MFEYANLFSRGLFSQFGERVAAMCGDRSCTYAELDRAINVLAARLHERGVRRGDRVALWGFNSINWLIAFFSVVRAGGVAVLVNYSLGVQDACALLELNGVSFLLCGDTVATKANPNAPQLLASAAGISLDRCLDMSPAAHDFVAELENTLTGEPIDYTPSLDATVLVIFTSGTTSTPKGVEISARALAFDCAATSEVLASVMGPRILVAAPLFHILGLLETIVYLLHGATVVYAQGNHCDTMAQLIWRHGITDMVSVGTVFLSLADVPSFDIDVNPYLRLCLIAGGITTPAQMTSMESRYQNAVFLNMYGQSESAPLTMVRPEDCADIRVRSVGKAVPGVELRIINEHGMPLLTGEVGEVVARTPGIMNGYAALGREQQPIDRNGWLHTGDLGMLDGDGHLFLTGRIKDIIIRGGENIAPAEVEEEIIKLGDVKQAKVMGAPHPLYGESVEACVVLRGQEPHMSGRALRDALKSRLPKFKLPAHIFVMDEFPLQANGKIDARALRASMLNLVRYTRIEEQLTGRIATFEFAQAIAG